jgi:hypothetical protein
MKIVPDNKLKISKYFLKSIHKILNFLVYLRLVFILYV